MTSTAEVWGSFPHDPRDAANASLRASDADRDVVQRVLSEAFADGRLDRDEYDERSSAALAARTLGQLPPLVSDLVPQRPLVATAGRVPLAMAGADELDRRAHEHWRTEVRNAFLGFLGTGAVLWVIWAVTMFGEFPWPLIVNAFMLLNVVRTVVNKQQVIATERRRLEKRQAKALEARNKKPGPASG